MTRWLHAGPFWLADDGRSVTAFDRATGARLCMEGALREAVLAGHAADPRLRALARVDASTGNLVQALAEGSPRRLTRADVLRGTRRALLFVELTGRCNERCSHCYADAGPERAETLDIEVVRRAVEDAAALGFDAVQLTGGDPLLHPQVVEAARCVREQGIRLLEIYTNGLLLGPALLDRLAPARPRFAFSVYSHDADVHDAITGVSGSHELTLRAIRGCVERELPVRAGVVLFEHTAEARETTRAFLVARGVPAEAVGFSASRAVGRGSAHDLADDVSGAAHGLGVAGGGKACIAYDGQVYPCIFARHRPLGDVRAQSLRSILEADLPIDCSVAELEHDSVLAAERLACLECRERDAFLSAPRARPVQIRTARTA